jgi:hypothetical protein
MNQKNIHYFRTQAFGNFGTHFSFQTLFLDDLTDKKTHVLTER